MILATDLTGWQIGLDVVVSLLFGAAGALGVWFKLKNVVNIQRVEIDSLKTSISAIRENKKELAQQLHKRVDSLKSTVETNREKSDNNTNEIKGEMQKMELRIITAIHEIKR
jgi:gas vesicle protein